VKTNYAGEMQLAGWSESHNGGCKVTFWLQSPEDLEAFRALTVRKGNTAGHRFMAALVEIGDDERPVEPVLDTPRPKPGPLCMEAIDLCKNPGFHKWLAKYHDFDYWLHEMPERSAAEIAGDCIREICEVQSRKEFDNEPDAAYRFITRIRLPFMRREKA
jgi:hypothetical protein